MPLTVLDHAIGAHLLARLRDAKTPPEQFRPLTRALTQILLVEATRNLPTRMEPVQTPLEETPGATLADEIVVVPVLRAGLGMLDACVDLLPQAAVGFVGLERDESTAIASSYYLKMPNLAGKTAIMLDPMLATGGSAAWAANQIVEAGAASVTMLCIVAAPEGIARLAESFPQLHVVAASLDRELNDRKYILPGLGDFGDRLYGTF